MRVVCQLDGRIGGSEEAVSEPPIGLRAPDNSVALLQQVFIESFGDLSGLGGAKENRIARLQFSS